MISADELSTTFSPPKITRYVRKNACDIKMLVTMPTLLSISIATSNEHSMSGATYRFISLPNKMANANVISTETDSTGKSLRFSLPS